MKKYKVTIEEIEEVEVTERGEHTVIDERPWTESEVKEENRFGTQSAEKYVEKNPVKRIYGYAPDRKKIQENRREILVQTVNEMDVPAVIKAVNGL